jgi:acetolactate synthase-1/2/3 large subunit
VGSGIKLANAVNEFRYLVKKLQIPVIFTSSAPDIYGSKNRISIGSAGSQGCTRAGNFVLQNSDLLIVLGCRLNSAVIGSDIKKFARRAKIILVNNNKNESIKIKKTIEIISDLKIFINSLNKKFFFPKKTKWLKKCIYWKKIFYNYEDLDNCKKKIGLYKFSEILSEIMPARSTFICDSGFVDVIMPTNIKFNNTQSCLHPVSQGMMGYAIPSIVGANQVKKRPIVCVVGDGSIMMNIQELQTISFNKIPAKIFVINNNLYGIIRRRQKNLFRERTIGTDPSNGLNAPNFKDVAKCFGFRYQKISSNKYAKEKIKKILELKSPILCEVLGSENQNYIEVSHAKNKFGKFVRRPLEDQSPFLDRNLFLKEMIIEPIDL